MGVIETKSSCQNLSCQIVYRSTSFGRLKAHLVFPKSNGQLMVSCSGNRLAVVLTVASFLCASTVMAQQPCDEQNASTEAVRGTATPGEAQEPEPTTREATIEQEQAKKVP